jgi:hypothetical protein
VVSRKTHQAFAGILVLGITFLGYFAAPDWFLFTRFVGAMITIFALTGICPMGIMLH